MKSNKLVCFFIALIALIGFDALWFLLTLEKLYHPLMGSLIAASPNFVAALAFYLIYSFGLCYFVIFPHINTPESSIKNLAKNAAIFGFIAYATYDMTALAVIAGFNQTLAIFDMLWGAFAAVLIVLSTNFAMSLLSQRQQK